MSLRQDSQANLPSQIQVNFHLDTHKPSAQLFNESYLNPGNEIKR